MIGLLDWSGRTIGYVALVGLAYYATAGFLFGKRYYRHWLQIRNNLKSLRDRRLELEREIQQIRSERDRDNVSTTD